jgi:hypothetical protein
MIEDFIFRKELEAAPWTPDLADPEEVHREWWPVVFTLADLVELPWREFADLKAKRVRPKTGPFGPTGYKYERHLSGAGYTETLRLIPVGPGEMAFDMVIDPACPPDRVYMVPKDWGLGGSSWL